MRAGLAEYRSALQQAERALMHAQKALAPTTTSDVPAVMVLVSEALHEVSRVLDIGRDEANEMTLT